MSSGTLPSILRAYFEADGENAFRPVTEQLCALLRGREQSVRAQAAEVLGLLGPAAANPEVLLRLREAIGDADGRVRSSAAAALERLGAGPDSEFTAHLQTMPVPTEHRLHTPLCPPLTRFPAGVNGGWTEDERAHTSRCGYCQSVIAMQWHFSPLYVALLAVLNYTRSPETFPDRQAMDEYLSQDRGWQLRLALSARSIRKLLEGFNQNLFDSERLRTIVRAIALSIGDAVPAGANFATESRPRIHSHTTSDDGTLAARLEETDDGSLVTYVATTSAGDRDRKVTVEVISKGTPLLAEIILKERASKLGGSHGKHFFGPASDFEYLLQGCTLVASWSDNIERLR